MLKAAGYYILIEMEEVERTSEGGIIIATKSEHDREQAGHDVGVVRAFGPNAFTGFRGINDDHSVEERAANYGVKVGDKVEFTRYDGKVPRHPDYSNYRLIQDEHIIGVYE